MAQNSSLSSNDNVTIKLGTLAMLVLIVQHLMAQVTSDEQSSEQKDAQIAALTGRLAQEDTDLATAQQQIATLGEQAGQPMPDDVQANIESIIAANPVTSQPSTPPPADPTAPPSTPAPAPTSASADPTIVPTGNPGETLTPGTPVPASVAATPPPSGTPSGADTGGVQQTDPATGAPILPNGQIAGTTVTGDLPGNPAPATGSNTGVGSAPPVQQGSESVEGSKLTPGEPSGDSTPAPGAEKP